MVHLSINEVDFGFTLVLGRVVLRFGAGVYPAHIQYIDRNGKWHWYWSRR